MKLSELAIPNQYGTPPTFIVTLGYVLEKLNDHYYGIKYNNISPTYFSPDVEVEGPNHKGIYSIVHRNEDGETHSKCSFEIMYLLPMTPENLLVHKTIGEL